MSWPADADAARLDAGRGALVLAGDGPTCVVLVVTAGGAAGDRSSCDPAADPAVGVARAARDLLAAEGIEASVVALVDPVAFAGQDSSYRDQVLPPAVPRVDMAGFTPESAAVDARRQLRRRR
jgi:hypothetical protein